MESQNVAQFVQEDKDLGLLLNENTIYFYSDFSDNQYDNDALRAYISADYYKSFKNIYEKNINAKSKALVVPLLKSVDFLATPEIKDQIIKEFLLPILHQSHESLSKLKADIDKEDIVAHLYPVDKALSGPIFQIKNQFQQETEIQEISEKILVICLDICDKIANISPTKDEIRYALYNLLINNLEKVKNFGALQSRFGKHQKKITATRDSVDNKYVTWAIIGALFLILRIAAKFFN